jgi:hypothetical protein
MKVAIVGAGPAGVAAADVLAAHGAAVTVIDEGREAGGQIYRRARAGLKLDVDALMGVEVANYRSFHAVFERLRDRIDYRPQTLAWGIDEKRLHTIGAGVADTVDVRRTHPCDGRHGPHTADTGLDLAGRVHARRRAGAAQGAWLPDRPPHRVLRQLAAALSRRQAIPRDGRRDRGGARHHALRGEDRGRAELWPRRRLSRAGLVHECASARGVPIHHGVRLAAFEATNGVERSVSRIAMAASMSLHVMLLHMASGSSLRRSLPISRVSNFATTRHSANGCRTRIGMGAAGRVCMSRAMVRRSAGRGSLH